MLEDGETIAALMDGGAARAAHGPTLSALHPRQAPETQMVTNIVGCCSNMKHAPCDHPGSTCRVVSARRSTNLMKWKCHIPGKADTDWDGGFYPLTMEFTEDYPTKPPKV